MEAVIRAFIHICLVFLLVLLERFLISRPAGIDALIDFREMQQQRRSDRRHFFRRRLRTIEWTAGGELGSAHRHHVGNPAAETEADYSYLAAAIGVCLQVVVGLYKVFQHLAAITLGLQFLALLIVARITAERSQRIRRQCHVPGDTEAARDILDIRIQAAVLVHDYHARQLLITAVLITWGGP